MLVSFDATLSSVPRATVSWVTLVPFDLEQVLEVVTFVNERRCDGGERGTEHRYLAQYPPSSWWLLNDDPYSNVVEVGAECQEHGSLLEWGRIGREGKKDRRKRVPVKIFDQVQWMNTGGAGRGKGGGRGSRHWILEFPDQNLVSRFPSPILYIIFF